MEPLDKIMAPEIEKVLKIAQKHANDSKKTSKVLRRLVAKHNGTTKEKSREVEKETKKPENKKRKILQILSSKDNEGSQPSTDATLTFDEQKALEMYEALRSKKAKMDSDHSSEDDDDDKVASQEKVEENVTKEDELAEGDELAE